MYKVTKEDLIGQIANFPVEVVQKMVERQVEQGNKADVTVFQQYKTYGKSGGGFTWDETEEHDDFWGKVINEEYFDLFFKKYPKTEEVDTHVYYRGVPKRGKEIISELKKLGGRNERRFNGNSDVLYYINPSNDIINFAELSDYVDLLKSVYTEKFLPEKMETVEIEGKKYNKAEVMDKLKELKEVE